MKIAIYGQSYNSNTQESIHTLLDFLLFKKIDVTLENDFFDEINRVITSYSIHYTKLYEVTPTLAWSIVLSVSTLTRHQIQVPSFYCKC